MVSRIVIGLCVMISFFGCSKENLSEPYDYLYLKVEGQEEEIRWETTNAKWDSSSGTFDLEAIGYNFDRCRIKLENISSVGLLNSITILQFYYTDGLDFMPRSVSGHLIITEVSNESISGTFDLQFEKNYSGIGSKKVTGLLGLPK